MGELDADGARVDPGDIDDFAKRLLEAADYWHEANGGPRKLEEATQADDWYPFMGQFDEADSFLQAHHGKWSAMATAFHQLHALLEGMSEGCKEVAKNYRDGEALNDATVKAVDALIAPEMQESMQDATPSGDQSGTPPAAQS